MSEKSQQHPILVPVDFSPYSKAALLQACELAQCMKRPLLVLHVVHDPGHMPGYYAKIGKKKNLLRIEDLAKEMFADFLQGVSRQHPDLKPLQKAETLLLMGLPVTRILEVIEKKRVSMVVMGSQGLTGLQHMLLGSMAEQIVRLSPVPVMIVKAS